MSLNLVHVPDEEIQKRCQDLEDYYSDIRSYKKENARLNTVIVEMSTALAEMSEHIKELETLYSFLLLTLYNRTFSHFNKT